MKKILALIMLTLLLVSCGSPLISWNPEEEKIFESFEQIKIKADQILNSIDLNKPLEYEQARIIGQPVWDWKEFEKSCIASIYGEWRKTTGTLLEWKTQHARARLQDPNYETMKAKYLYGLDDYKIQTKNVLDAIEKLKVGKDPFQ